MSYPGVTHRSGGRRRVLTLCINNWWNKRWDRFTLTLINKIRLTLLWHLFTRHKMSNNNIVVLYSARLRRREILTYPGLSMLHAKTALYKPGVNSYLGVDTRGKYLPRAIFLNSYLGLTCNPNDVFLCCRGKKLARGISEKRNIRVTPG